MKIESTIVRLNSSSNMLKNVKIDIITIANNEPLIMNRMSLIDHIISIDTIENDAREKWCHVYSARTIEAH